MVMAALARSLGAAFVGGFRCIVIASPPRFPSRTGLRESLVAILFAWVYRCKACAFGGVRASALFGLQGARATAGSRPGPAPAGPRSCRPLGGSGGQPARDLPGRLLREVGRCDAERQRVRGRLHQRADRQEAVDLLGRGIGRVDLHFLADSSGAGRRGAGGVSARDGGRLMWAGDSPLPGVTDWRRMNGPSGASGPARSS